MIHAITDGRDTSPTGGANFLATVSAGIAGAGAQVSHRTDYSLQGYVDRDKRWDRTKLAWDAIVLGRGAGPLPRPLMQSSSDMPGVRPTSF